MSSLMLRPPCIVILGLVCGAAHAGVDARTFPLQPASAADAPAGTLAALPGALEELALLRRVELVDVELPGGALVDLQLQRVPVAAGDAALVVDGARQPGALDAGISLWSGHVAGDPRSEVFLGFSRHGSRGWVRTGGDLFHLLARPGAGDAWGASVSSWSSEAQLRAVGPPPPLVCKAMEVASHTPVSLPRLAGSESASTDGGVLPILECHMVVETDYQFFQLFDDVDAAKTYALELLGAVSDRYRGQIGVIISIPFLELYSTPADPWTSPETGDSFSMLLEFQTAWGPGFGGNPPQVGDVYHFLSGAGLGGGIAYLPGLCDQDYGFAVSGDLGGITPFPVAVGPLNWDFIVVAHETGHIFNAPHTHDYCPPLDQCAPAGYFGACQTQEVCTDQGTIMSYCHLCGAGMLNETTFFHPVSVSDMRAAAEGCLQPFEGIFVEDLGFAKTGSGGTPTLAVSYTSSPDTVHINAAFLPHSKPGALFQSLAPLYAPFKGGVLVPDAMLVTPLVSQPNGSLPLALPVPISFPSGITVYAQEWFKDTGAGYAATNGVRFELIVP